MVNPPSIATQGRFECETSCEVSGHIAFRLSDIQSLSYVAYEIALELNPPSIATGIKSECETSCESR